MTYHPGQDTSETEGHFNNFAGTIDIDQFYPSCFKG